MCVKKAIASPTKKYVPVFARFNPEKALCGAMKNQSAARYPRTKAKSVGPSPPHQAAAVTET